MIRRWEILFYLETHFSALRREYAMKWVGSKQLSFIWAKWLFSCEICRFGNDWIKWLNAYFPILDDTKEGSARFLLPSSLFSPSLKGTFYGDHHRGGIDTITTTSTHFSRGLYSFSFWSFFIEYPIWILHLTQFSQCGVQHSVLFGKNWIKQLIDMVLPSVL